MSRFSHAVSRSAREQPGKVAVVDERRRLTYSELDALVDRVAGALAARGAGPDDVISSQLPNCVEALALCLAANRLGVIHNPVPTIFGRRELEFVRRQAGSAVFVDDVDDELFHAPPAGPGPAGSDDDAPRFLVYTSGSTAEPKGVLHSDRTLSAECAAQAAYHELGGDEVFVMPSPVAHVSGLLYGVLLPVWLGATIVLLARWDPGRFLELVEAERGTFSAGAPPFLRGIVDHPELERFETSSLRVFACGGAEVPPELIRRARRRLGVRTGRGYGSTEFPSITAASGPGEPEDKRAETDGRPIGTNEVRIVDGEIQARGPELFLGYRDPALDADAFADGHWLRTGDLGTIDAEGYLTVTGRLKEVIIRSGEKISAREVEELLTKHRDVVDVAVIALPDLRTGERACACVVPRSESHPPTLRGLVAHLGALGLSRRKHPEQLEIVTELPLTVSGKVDKRALRARVAREGA